MTATRTAAGPLATLALLGALAMPAGAASLPGWAGAWMAAHPGDRVEAEQFISREPVPLHKIPKGQELAKLP